MAYRQHHLDGEDNRLTLSGAGPGLRYSITPYLDLRADYGIVLQDAGQANQNNRWHVGLLLSF